MMMFSEKRESYNNNNNNNNTISTHPLSDSYKYPWNDIRYTIFFTILG